MPLWLLGAIDRWAGPLLLLLLAWPLRLLARFLPAASGPQPRYIFIKMKGGGSLIIAMPSLLGLRRALPHAQFSLVCTPDVRPYAELTNIFDDYLVVDDTTPFRLAASAARALCGSFRADRCIDLEPNSILAAVFTALTCAARRYGFTQDKSRAAAYTDILPFNKRAPIYTYYDRLCAMLGGMSADIAASRTALRGALPPPVPLPQGGSKIIGIAAFTSDFARERMMPPRVWAALLARAFGDEDVTLYIFGSTRNRPMAQDLAAALRQRMPRAVITDLCGQYPLRQTAAQMALCDEIWAVDSGLLHVARLSGVPTQSFWGPTRPEQRLRPMPDLRETAHYRPFACSPCLDAGKTPPCRSLNVCLTTMADSNPDLFPSWTQK
ncbi:MAG: glycosyltransferase family 9 protein [Alphaproteobacteria bacterium]|nr:glycosyltransferase family 9 protein [Alphaproteobacteria bacterium]